MSALLAGCGGDGGSGGGGSGSGSTAASGGTVTTAGCSLRERQDWVNAQMREWYLFPETLPASLNPAGYASVPDYLNALTATAREQGKDRYFTYLTSIKSENAYYGSGSSAGFGWRLAIDGSGRLQVTEAFESAPALAAGIDRGAEILAIGTSTGNLQTVSSLYAAGGSALSDALGPNTAGTARVFQIRDGSGTRTVSVAKADFTLAPVSSRYGAQIITDGGQRYGYVNLRTFIDTADPALRAAFDQFRSAGVTSIIVDLRYNGGGLINIAELMSNLLGANRQPSEVMTYTTFRSDKAARNTTTYFNPQSQSVAATRIAFIGAGATASASEYVINAFIPYLHANAGLIGSNTYGKPVGQIALDKSECDDRLRVIAFALQNAARQGAYYSGLAGTVEASCRAADDINYPMGDPREASTRAALDFLQGKTCTPIRASASASTASEARALSVPVSREALQPDPARMSPAQREVPGLF